VLVISTKRSDQWNDKNAPWGGCARSLALFRAVADRHARAPASQQRGASGDPADEYFDPSLYLETTD